MRTSQAEHTPPGPSPLAPSNQDQSLHPVQQPLMCMLPPWPEEPGMARWCLSLPSWGTSVSLGRSIVAGNKTSDPAEPGVMGMGGSQLVRHWNGCERGPFSPPLDLHLGPDCGRNDTL